MTNRELWKKLKQAGWKQISGGKHDMDVDPKNPARQIPVPRHRGEVPIGTANAILSAAGLK